MINTTRAQLYRMFHERKLLIFLAVLVFPIILAAICAAILLGNETLVSFLTSTSSDISRIVDATSESSMTLPLYGSVFVNGSFVAMVACCYTAMFAAPELSEKRAGFAKNLLQARGGRLSLACSHVIAAAVAGALFVLVCIAATALCFGLAGFPVMPPAFGAFALWALQVWLVTLAYQALTLVLVFITKSEVVSAVFGVLLGGFAIETALVMAVDAAAALVGPLPTLETIWSFLTEHSLMAQLQLLGHGTVCSPDAYAIAIVTVIVSAGIGLAVMRRRSLA